MSTIFTKIINRELPAEIVYEDELCLAFKDIQPRAPVHVLLIPKKPIVGLDKTEPSDAALLGHMMVKAREVAALCGAKEFRLVANSGASTGQTVFHLHFHILAGRSFEWPPG
jgi:histidine triad (HIT) family protein